MSYVWLLLSLGSILLAAELFTNAIEWFGKRLKIAEGAVGSVLAAVGTALPETSVAIVGVILARKQGAHSELGQQFEHAGIGAILGAPMMLSTLAFFVTGSAVLYYAAKKTRKKEIDADYKVVGRDLRSFFLVYSLALVAALVDRPLQLVIAAVLFGIYAVYVYRTFSSGEGHGEAEMRPLHFRRKAMSPKMRFIIAQIAAGLALMIFGADLFIRNLTEIARELGASTSVLALIITPIATELPEKFNSITWMRHRKDTLALGNITGAMVFQSSVLPAIGIVFTSWQLDTVTLAAIVVAIAATFVAWADMTLRKRLSPYSMMAVGLLYVAYAAYALPASAHH